MRSRLLLLVVCMTTAACSPAQPAATTTSTIHETTTEPPATTSTSTPVTSTSPPNASTTTTIEIDVEVRGGEVIGPDHFDLNVGETVDVWVVSDVADELHIHGYDIFYALEPGVAVNVRFVADVPGVFEVELETSHQRLFEIEVSG